MDSINQVDHLGQGMQAMQQYIGKKTKWKQYHVSQPNVLWHIDSHHKLIAWGIVIHGVADGYSPKVHILPCLKSIHFLHMAR